MPKFAELIAPRQIEIREKNGLRPGPGEVRIDVRYAGICGTDRAIFSGDYPVPLPQVCGHEFAGTVQSVGEGVDRRWEGRRVTAEINNTCLAYRRTSPCPACRRGMPSHCSRRTVTGILGHLGAFAQEVTVAAGCLHELPESLDFLTATLTEPLAAALQTFEMSPVSKGETGVVVGPGRLGILIVFLAVLRGLRVLAVSRSAAKRQRAEAFGAARSLAPKEAAAVVRDLTQGLGADWVVDATGHPEGLPLALSLARPRGTVAVKTTCGRPTPGLDLTRLVVDEVRIQGSRCGPFPPALQILTDHQERLKPLISSVLPLVAAQEALASADRESKVVLDAKPT